ncbi:MAG: glycosyltransferase [Acidobacteria bacterium]|nr:glycosyltransferase [Acidobacteriota bacterium]
MKVAFLLNKFPLLSETFVLNQITGLIDRGCAVDVYVRGRVREEKVHADVERYGLSAVDLHQDRLAPDEKLGLLAHTLKTALWRGRSTGLLGACLRKVRPGRVHDALVELYPAAALLERGPYSIVHAHYGINGNWATALRSLGGSRAKVVTTFHDGFDLSAYLALHGRDAYRPVFEHGDLILPISEAVQRRLLDLGCPASKLAVHRVGVDLRRFPAQAPAPRTDGIVRICSVARLVEMKGVEHGIRAVARLLREGAAVEYRIAGDGPLQAELRALISELGVEEKVRLLGWQEMREVERLLAESDVFLAPSVTDAQGSQEGIPTVLMEAMANRMPVVSTAYSGIPELVRDGVDGYLTAEADVEAIADRLRRLAESPAQRRAMGEKGREQVEALHDIERLNDRLLDRYRALARGESGR